PDRNWWRRKDEDDFRSEDGSYLFAGPDGRGVRRGGRLGATGAAKPGCRELGWQVGWADCTLGPGLGSPDPARWLVHLYEGHHDGAGDHQDGRGPTDGRWQPYHRTQCDDGRPRKGRADRLQQGRKAGDVRDRTR